MEMNGSPAGSDTRGRRFIGAVKVKWLRGQAAAGVTVVTSFEQLLCIPLNALTAKKYRVFGSRPVMVAAGALTSCESW